MNPSVQTEIEARAPAQAAPRPLHIVHTISSLQCGGMEQFALRLAALQARHGHRTGVMSLRGGPLLETARSLHLDVRVLGSSHSLVRVIDCAAWLRLRHPDIIHVHNPTSLHYAAFGTVGSRAKIVLTLHGQCAGPPRKPTSWELRRTDACVSVSDDVAERDRAEFQNTGIFTVIRNGVDPTPPRRRRAEVRAELALADGVTAIVVARLQPIKDHETLLNALAILKRDGLELNLLVVGDGKERARLEALVPALGLDPARVRFLGFRTDVPDLLTAADLFVLSSLQEGLPLAMLEAMSQRLPVVATSVGGVPEVIVPGENGFLVPKKSAAQLAAALARVACSPELAARLGAAGEQLVRERYSFAGMAAAYEDLYRRVLGR